MPKLRKSVQNRADDSIRAGIKGTLLMEKGTDDYKELAPILNVHVNTIYNRVKNPGSFQLEELRRMFNTLHWSNSQILAIFGREEGGVKSA